MTAFSSFSGTAFGIVEPFPENIYPLEFTSAEVTCVAFDAEGVLDPEKIIFMRRDEFDNYEEIMPSGRLRFTNRSTLVGKYIYTRICIKLRFVDTIA